MIFLSKYKWNVKPISLNIAKPFVQQFHYSKGCSTAAVNCFGLYFNGDNKTLHGVSWWMPPPLGASKSVMPENPHSVLSLHRFCLREDRPENAGSFLISKSIKMICKKRWLKLITYADTALNHNGGLYRASNWIYNGLTNKNPLFWNSKKDCMVSRKKGPKTFTVKEMLSMGYKHLGNYAKHRFIYPMISRNQYQINQTELIFTEKGKIRIN